jgi:hypothetical protein
MKIQDQKFNGKIYGKSGDYSIYLNNVKTSVTDQDVTDYNEYVKMYNDLKEKNTGVLNCIEVQDINVAIGNEKRFQELSFEQLSKKMQLFKVTELINATIGGVKVILTKCEYEGKFVKGYFKKELNGKEEEMYLSEEETNAGYEQLSNEIK